MDIAACFPTSEILTDNYRKNIQEAFEREFTVPDNSINIQTAIGITAFNPDTALAPLEIYQQALTALQRAKLNNISHVQFFEASMQTLALEAFQLEEEIHQAIANKEFVMYYQPQVSAQTHTYRGAEALIRWQKPNGEIIPPYKFIPLLESTGLIISVGYWLLETALKETLALPCFSQNKFTLSINLSGVQFKDPYLISTIKDIIGSCEFPPARLMLEVTESSLIDDTELAFKQLNAIQDMGIQIAIDDFGTGYSSFAYLKDMPVNELKIADPSVYSTQEAMSHGLIGTLPHRFTLSHVLEDESELMVDFFETEGLGNETPTFVDGPDGQVLFREPSTARFYTGNSSSHDGLLAAMNVLDGQAEIFLSSPTLGNIFMGKRMGQNLEVSENASFTPGHTETECASDDHLFYEGLQKLNTRSSGNASCKKVYISVTADDDLYNIKGRSVSRTSDYIKAFLMERRTMIILLSRTSHNQRACYITNFFIMRIILQQRAERLHELPTLRKRRTGQEQIISDNTCVSLTHRQNL